MVYSYHVSHPSELRHDVRINFEKFLSGELDGDDTATPSVDERPFTEQATSLMDDLDLFTSQFSKQQPEPTPETELE